MNASSPVKQYTYTNFGCSMRMSHSPLVHRPASCATPIRGAEGDAVGAVVAADGIALNICLR